MNKAEEKTVQAKTRKQELTERVTNKLNELFTQYRDATIINPETEKETYEKLNREWMQWCRKFQATTKVIQTNVFAFRNRVNKAKNPPATMAKYKPNGKR
jgi:hypothetical protein